MKQPQLLTLQNIFDTLNNRIQLPSKCFFRDGLGVVIDMNNIFQPFIQQEGRSPYLIEDYRTGYLKQGYIHGIINLQEYTISAGHIVFITPGTIIELLDVSDNFQFMGMGVPADLFHLIHQGSLPDLFNGKQKNGFLAISASEGLLIDHMYRMLCEIALAQNNENLPSGKAEDTPATYHMAATITAYYNHLFSSQSPQGLSIHTNSHDIFNRFIHLVNLHGQKEHQLSFYADKLCLTERYLGTVIRKASGITAKEWIDKAVVTAAKVKLRHSHLQIAEITKELHFPNPSFFCKYFKRLVGCTPLAYRERRNLNEE